MSTDVSKFDILKGVHVAGPEFKPKTVTEVGVRESILEDIALKTLYLYGPFSVADLAEQSRLSYDAAEQLFSRLRTKLLCEVTGMTGTVPVIAISSQGRTRALELLSQNQYSGAMPVSLASYVAQVRKQSMRNVKVRTVDVERAFAHLVFNSEVLSELGTALNSGNAVFLYGPPGAGKTAAAEAMSNVFTEDGVWIPFAVEVGGQIITVYDPAIHGDEGDKKPNVERFGEKIGNLLWERFTVHYTPKHGSWLNQAEIEISLFSRQCLGKRRIPSIRDLRLQAKAWNRRMNHDRVTIDWQFTRGKARSKFGYKRTDIMRSET